MKDEFDRFADEYHAQLKASVAFSGEDPAYFSEYKIVDVAREVGKRSGGAASAEILDFGCGVGNSVPFVRQHLPGARLTCLDPSRRSLQVAEERFPSQARFVTFDGTRVPFPDGTFDVAFAMCVFHHIPAQEQVPLLSELRRVLKPRGLMFVFEHNPWNPLTVKVVRDCPFDENAVLISPTKLRRGFEAAGFEGVDIRYRLYFPALLSGLRPLERLLTRLPLGAQYYAMSAR